MVFLKQFRDAADPTRACYQAIVEANAARRGALRRTSLLPGELRVSVRRESGIAEALGLRASAVSAETITSRSLAALYLELDFTLEPGKVVWSASPLGEPRRIEGRGEQAPVRLVGPPRVLRISA